MIGKKSIAITILLLSFILIIASASSALAGGRVHGEESNSWGKWGQEQGKNASGFLNGRPEDLGHERLMSMRMRGATQGLFGGFDFVNESVKGRFVTFDLLSEPWRMVNYTLKGDDVEVSVFDAIAISGLSANEKVAHGSVAILRDELTSALLHDNPTGMLSIMTNATNVSVSFLLSSGMAAVSLPPALNHSWSHAVVVIYGRGMMGIIASDGAELVVETANARTFINVSLSHDRVMFRAKPLLSYHQAHGDVILTAITQGRVAGEISVIRMYGITAFDAMHYNKGFMMWPTSSENNRLRFMVQNEEHIGKVLIINVDDTALEAEGREIKARIDGKDVRITSDPLEVLSAEGSNPEDAVFCVRSAGGVSQLMIYVPSFSTHQIEISSIGPFDVLTSTEGALALVGAAALVIMAAMVLVRRRN